MKHSLKLALGEGSNTHILHSEKEIQSTLNPDDEIEFLLKGTGVVLHEEHDRIVLDKGKYVKYPQMEYNPFIQRMNRVFD